MALLERAWIEVVAGRDPTEAAQRGFDRARELGLADGRTHVGHQVRALEAA